MLKSLCVAALVPLSICAVSVNAQTGRNQSLALTNHPADATSTRPADRPVSPEARSKARKLYKEGVKYGEAGLFPQAAEIFKQVVALDPYFSDAFFSLGHAYFDMKRWAEAADSLERALELNPRDVEARDRLSFARTMLQPYGGGTKPVTAKAPAPVAPRTEQKPSGAQVSMTAKVPTPTIENTEPAVRRAKADNKTTAENEPTTETKPTTENKTNNDEMALTRIYRIGPNDVLDVRVVDSTSSQSTLFTVTPSGHLEHPLLSEPMQVGGMTVDELTTRIETELKRRALDNTKVSIGVRDYASHTILVSGLVKEPGTKILRREAIPLYVVAADAQPLPEAARVTVVRNESNETFEIDLSESSEMNLLVRPGDVVTLAANVMQFVYVGGEVKFPGEKTYRRGLTLTQVMISAGGVLGKPKEARLGRDDGRGFLTVTKFKLKDIESGKVPDPVVRPGDRIMVMN
ncbi:MAG TPA: polysaccharide biosynthesis/export family protein [Pyrinomonadaceae bacterium]|nr:polysaccharide biosynthesis/export family protein [Pyrinomonadaceae bacterium]